MLARVGADAGAPTHTHERARTRARMPVRGRGACLPWRHAYTTIGKYRPIGMRHVCQPVAVRRGNRTRTHEAQRRTASPAHTGMLVHMGEAPIHILVHGIAQEPYLQIIPCIDLNIPGTWVASEAHTHTNTRVQQLVPARPSAYAAVGVNTGDPHIREDIYIFAQLYNTLASILPEFRSLHALQRAAIHTRTPTHTHSHVCAHNGGVETDTRVHTTYNVKRSMRVCVGHR